MRKRLLVHSACLSTLLVASSASGDPCGKGGTCFSGGPPYHWSVSASESDPFVNTTVLQGGPVAIYYLWFVCAEVPPGGMSAAEFEIVASGPAVLATNPQNGYLNAGSATHLLLAVGGCPTGPVVAAQFLVFNMPGTICLAPSAANGTKGVVDCDPNPTLWPMGWVGLQIDDPIAVEATSWGSIKQHFK